MIKAFRISIIIFTLTYVFVGAIFVKNGLFDNGIYTVSMGVISGIASVVTIYIAITQSSLKSELSKIQPSLLKDITSNMELLNSQKELINDTKNKLTEQEKQLLTLGLKKSELEFAVKKASLSIFLNDQLERNNVRLKEIIERNREIIECIENRKSIESKLTQLHEEVKQDENYQFFYELIQKDDFNERKLSSNGKLFNKLYSVFYGDNK